MKENNALPSQEYLNECIDYNEDTGECFWKDTITVRNMFTTKYNNISSKPCGFIHNNSIKIRIDKVEYYLVNILVKLIENLDDCFIVYNDGDESNLIWNNLTDLSILSPLPLGRGYKNAIKQYLTLLIYNNIYINYFNK